MSSTAPIVTFVPKYSDASVAIFGNTKPYRTPLRDAGGKFCPGLTNSVSGQKEAGWVFSAKKAGAAAEKLVIDINSGVIQPESEAKPAEASAGSKATASFSKGGDAAKMTALEERVATLERTIARVQAKLRVGKEEESD
jgi:uncharacterized small protein (DUF1192 family)